MRRLALAVIRFVTPAVDREWVLGDTVEEFSRLEHSCGPRAARRWLRQETWRILLHAPRHRRAVRRSAAGATAITGDRFMSTVRQDLRYALRLLGRSPGFAAIAILTLALGIGINTAMFAVVNAVLLKPLPFERAGELMFVHLTRPDFDNPSVIRPGVWSQPKYVTFAAAQQVFGETGMFSPRDVSLTGDDQAERAGAEVVTDRYGAVLGIAPILGRAFTPAEVHTAGAPRVAMISHGLWSRRLGADPNVLNRTIQINAVPYTIVAVLPRGFRGLGGRADVWVPLGTFEPSQLQWAQSHSYYLVARRKPNVSAEAARAAVAVLGGQVAAAHPDRTPGVRWGASVTSLDGSRVDVDVRRASLVLLGAVGFVLLIACVNLTNLLAAKAMTRRREVAVRAAIGASRQRLVSQFLAEGAVLAASGTLAGLALAWTLLHGAAWVLPESNVFFGTSIAPGVPRTPGAAGLTRIGAAMIGVDSATLLFACGAAVVTTLLISLLPAVQQTALNPMEALKGGGRSSTARGFGVLSTRGALLTLQIALALVLLTGAGLMVKSVSRLYGTNIGVSSERVLTFRIDLPRSSYSAETGQSFYDRLTARLRAVPGVASVGIGNCSPVSGGCSSTSAWFPPSRMADAQGRAPGVGIYWTSPEYFSTMGIRLLRGRGFTDGDRVGQPRVVLVNDTAARRFWPNDTAVGKRIAVGQGGFHDGDGAEVIGIVSDVRYRSIETAAVPDVYLPLAQSYYSGMRFFVRSHVDPHSLVTAVSKEVRALDPNLPLSEVKTMDERVGDAMWRTRVGAWLLSAFSALALLLTAMGIFGVMAQTVSQRTAEIGVRMALGAQTRDVFGLVLGRAAIVTGAGLLLGIGSALVLTRLIGSLLYDVEPYDPLTFVAVAVLLGAVALAACYVPARRATRVDAVVALRTE